VTKVPADRLVLLVLDGYGGTISGRTLLQKRLYFVSHLAGLEVSFRPHYYGPYSQELEDAVALNRARGFLEETETGLGYASGSGFEIRRYDYKLTEDGRKMVNLIKAQSSDVSCQVTDAINRLNEAGDSGSYLELALAAKTYFIISSGGKRLTPDEISKQAKAFGWKVKPEVIQKAVGLLEKANMV